MLKTEAVTVWRDLDGDYYIEWEQSHPDTRVIVEPLAAEALRLDRDGAACRMRISGLPGDNRHFFRLYDQHGNAVLVAERRLGMQGTPNFRDFGGYVTVDGRRVKWGYLYRSGQLAHLSDRDIALLDSLQLELICDFRQESEQRIHPSRLPAGGLAKVVSLPIVPGSNTRFFAEAEAQQAAQNFFGRQQMVEFMLSINRDFAESQRQTFARMFREILALERGRFLVHCSAGKDRTGFAVALILLALGVPREQVMEDYLLTARYFIPDRELERVRAKYRLEQLESDAILPMLEVHEAYLAQALASIDESYGGAQRYLAEALGVGLEEQEWLKQRYLEPI